MFAKLFSSITESSLWSEPKEVRLLFVTMLAKADQAGFVEASIPGLARVANLTIQETEAGLECLQSPDTYSKNPDNAGRRVLTVPGGFVLLNYEDYRSRRSTEERREYMREYMKDYRKQNVNKSKQSLTKVKLGKPPLSQAETETETETEAISSNEASASVAVATHPQWQQSIRDFFDTTFGTKSRITRKRQTALNARWKDQWWQDNWQAALDRGGQSAFLRGGNDRGWVIDFEFFLKPDTATKILEGKYDDRQGTEKLSNAQAREKRNADSFQWIIDGAEEARRIAKGNGDRASTAANVLVEDGG